MAQNTPPSGSPPGQPPAGTPHHQHHHVPGAAAPGTHPDPEIDPALLNNPLVKDFLFGHLPSRMTKADGYWVAAPEGVPVPVVPLSQEEAVKEIIKLIENGFIKAPDTLASAFESGLWLWMLRDGIDPSALRTSFPYNTPQVRAGGYATLKVCTTYHNAAEMMKLDVPALGRDLAQSERIRAFRGVIDRIYNILDANETQVMTRIANRVEEGKKNGLSMIQGNGLMMDDMGPALAIRADPVQKGLETRAQNARQESQIRADEQTRIAAQGGPDPHKGGTVTTVTTEVPATPASTPAKLPTTQGSKKKGQ